MTNLAYVNRGQFRPAGPQSPDQAGMANTPMLALIALVTPRECARMTVSRANCYLGI